MVAVPTNLHTLLSGQVVEWARLEFKETWDPQASLKTICAFANDIDNWGGGYIVIGVQEKEGRPVFPLKGIPPQKADAWQKDIFEKCKLIHPDYMPIVSVEEYEGKLFLVIWAPGGSTRPYSSPRTMAKGDKEYVYWIRKGSLSVKPTAEEVRDLYSLANNVPFDDRPNHTAELADLSPTLVKAYLKEIGSSLYSDADAMDFLDVCRSLNIVNALPEYTKPKNVGLMFFCMDPERFFPYARIEVVQFPDDSGEEIHERTFTGPIHQQLREALLHIRNAYLEERVIKHDDVAEAERFFNYPFAAVEEALSNAVYHKGYNVREPIEVRLETDRMIIVSHPGADRSISLKNLREGRVYSRMYRNRRVGDFLKEMHLTEGRNTGFRKIRHALQRNGSPAPLFETDEERTYFATTLFIHPAFTSGRPAASISGNETSGETFAGWDERNETSDETFAGGDERNETSDETFAGEDERNETSDETFAGEDERNETSDETFAGWDERNETSDETFAGWDERNETSDETFAGWDERNETSDETFAAAEEPRETSITPIEARFLRYVEESPAASVDSLRAALSISRSSVYRISRSLQEKGLLQRIGPRKDKKWVVMPLRKI